jgi:Putative MetA-pathway of phenol degradation
MRMKSILPANRSPIKLAFSVLFVSLVTNLVRAQDLAPRAYMITPLHSNAINVTWSFYKGALDFNGVVPVNDASGTYSVSTFTYYHSLNFFGRSANIAAGLPYAVGTFQAAVLGTNRTAYRSGLVDSGFRFSVNLKGGPAMPIQQFVKWKQKVVLGASLRVIIPTGQYDATKLIQWGINRWGFKPEFGYSQRWGKWVLDGYAGEWFFTTNHNSFSIPVPKPQTQSPIGSLEGHLSYDMKGYKGRPTPWLSLDGNFWFGGTTSLGGISNPATRQTASRIGATAALPLTHSQTIKISYSKGAYVRFGGDYQNLSVGWQYSWLGRPR